MEAQRQSSSEEMQYAVFIYTRHQILELVKESLLVDVLWQIDRTLNSEFWTLCLNAKWNEEFRRERLEWYVNLSLWVRQSPTSISITDPTANFNSSIRQCSMHKVGLVSVMNHSHINTLYAYHFWNMSRGRNKVYWMFGQYVPALSMHFYNLSGRACHSHPILYLYIPVHSLHNNNNVYTL